MGVAIPDSWAAQAINLRGNPKLPNDIEEFAQLERARWKQSWGRILRSGHPRLAGGLYYQDSRPPWLVADTGTATLLTTQTVLWPVADLTPTYANDWYAGKQFMLRCFGRITTPASAGALTIQFGYGTASGVTGALATSAALTVVASQTNISWRFEGRIRCRAVGPGASAGILLGTGVFECNTAVLAAGQALIPATAPAQVTGLNLAQSSGIHLQMAEAATTGATVVVHDLELIAQN